MDDKTIQFILATHSMPSKLNGKSVDSGYSVEDIDFLAKKWALEQSVNYIDLGNFFNVVLAGKPDDDSQIQKSINKNTKSITGAIQIRPGDWYWISLLNFYAMGNIEEKQRLVIPFLLNPGGARDNHFIVMGFDFDPKSSAVDIILLEQHAMNKNETVYDELLDYSDMTDVLLRAIKKYCEQFLHYSNVNVAKNEKPISRRKRVCGVVASEMARQILSVDSLKEFMNNLPKLSDNEIDKLHQRNKNYSQNIQLQGREAR